MVTKKLLILEPQSWKNYTKAKRRVRVLDKNVNSLFQEISVTGSELPKFIDKVLMTDVTGSKGFTVKKICGETKWGRPVIIYTKSNINSTSDNS